MLVVIYSALDYTGEARAEAAEVLRLTVLIAMATCSGAVGMFFFSSRRRHTRCSRDWSSDVCSSDLGEIDVDLRKRHSKIGRPQRPGDGLSRICPAYEIRANVCHSPHGHYGCAQVQEIGRASCRERV